MGPPGGNAAGLVRVTLPRSGSVDYIGANETKTLLSRLLDEVAAGRSYTITKHGVPVALLLPVGRTAARPEEVIRELLEFRRGMTTGGSGISAAIENGRQ